MHCSYDGFHGRENKEDEVSPFYPDDSHQNLVFASHIGRVPERDKVSLGSFCPVIECGYWPSIYSYHNSKILQFTFVRPVNVDQKYVETIIGMTREIYEFIKNDIKL